MNVPKKALSLILSFALVAGTAISSGAFAEEENNESGAPKITFNDLGTDADDWISVLPPTADEAGHYATTITIKNPASFLKGQLTDTQKTAIGKMLGQKSTAGATPFAIWGEVDVDISDTTYRDAKAVQKEVSVGKDSSPDTTNRTDWDAITDNKKIPVWNKTFIVQVRKDEQSDRWYGYSDLLKDNVVTADDMPEDGKTSTADYIATAVNALNNIDNVN